MSILDNNKKKQPQKIRIIRAPTKRSPGPCVKPVAQKPVATPSPKPAKPALTPKVFSPDTVFSKNFKPVAPCKSKKGTKKMVRAIPAQDWKIWEPIFTFTRDTLGIYFESKAQLEKHLDEKAMWDGYDQYYCMLNGTAGKTITMRFAREVPGKAPELKMLAISHLFRDRLRIITQTSIAHEKRSGCDPWNLLHIDRCTITRCCRDMCFDTPETGPITRYENSLRLAKKDAEIQRLHGVSEEMYKLAKKELLSDRMLALELEQEQDKRKWDAETAKLTEELNAAKRELAATKKELSYERRAASNMLQKEKTKVNRSQICKNGGKRVGEDDPGYESASREMRKKQRLS